MNPVVSFLIVLVFVLVQLAGSARATELVLENGWVNAPFATSPAEAFSDHDMVYLKGAVAGGSTEVLFTLPPLLRPLADVYVSVDLCSARQGRLWIQSSGVTSVQVESGIFSDAQCFTSLDGVRFARPGIEFQPLTLSNGWVGAPFGTSTPGVALMDGIVHLRGAVSGGTNATLFTLPVDRRPATNVFVPVGLCDGAKGRLTIAPSGTVTVSTPTGSITAAQCFTSLDGVSFAPSESGFTPLVLNNTWTNAPFGTSNAAVSLAQGVVRFKGAIAGGANGFFSTLPAEMWPATRVFIPVDLCGGAKGRLNIGPTGDIIVENFSSSAQCFTSLDGAMFVAPPPDAFEPLALQNGWINGVFSTQTASVVLYDDIVYFKGAVTTGATATLFTLPITLRPERDAIIAVDLCNGATGRISVQRATGHVTVTAPGGFFQASCFTSLEGASFARTNAGFTDLPLVNLWQSPVFQADRAAAKKVNGIVHLRGGVANGTDRALFTLPVEMRPASFVHLAVGLCGGVKGRLFIQPNGVVTVNPAPLTLSDAQCFTSLDGVKFAAATSGFSPLPLSNGWVEGEFLTRTPAATIHRDIVYLQGAISDGTLSEVFLLPASLRPEGDVYVPVDLCNGVKGRLLIRANGDVSVSSQTTFADAQCFTSLEGVSYAVPEPAAVPTLMAGMALLAGLARRQRHAQAG